MIPKIIHYCWFGRGTKSKDVIKCIDSWKKYCPDYEIIEWNEDNFDVNAIKYTLEAYKSKKWAFVSDYARFKILFENGGLYFDTDVEIIKDLKPVLNRGGFMGCEIQPQSKNKMVNPGLGLAIAPGLGLYKEILDYYNTIHFLNDDGSFNLGTVVEYVTPILQRYGFEDRNEIQYVNGVYIYPTEYFCPMNYETGKLTITENTYSIHHYTASWQPFTMRFKTKIKKLVGIKMTKRLKRLFKKN